MKYSKFIKAVIAQLKETEKQNPGTYFICLAITDVHVKTDFLYKDHARKLKKAVQDRIKKQRKDCADSGFCPRTLSMLPDYYKKKKGLSLTPLEARVMWLESLVKYHSSRGN